MSALTEPIAQAISAWSEGHTATKARLDLRILPIPKEGWAQFCQELRSMLDVSPVRMSVYGQPADIYVNKTHQFAIIVALRQVELPLQELDAWAATEDFVVRLRDLHGEPGPLSALNLVLVIDSDMESIFSTTIDLAQTRGLHPTDLILMAVPHAGADVKAVLRLRPVAAAVEQALRTMAGNERITNCIATWQADGLPPAEAIVTDLLGWFRDPELVSLAARQNQPQAEARALKNKDQADAVERLRARNASSKDWQDEFDFLSSAKVQQLQRDGPGSLGLDEVLNSPAAPKFEGFRWGSGPISTYKARRTELHVLVCEGKKATITADYSQAASHSELRITCDGVRLAPAEANVLFDVSGKEIRLRLPENAGPGFKHYIFEIFYNRPQRGKATQKVLALVSPQDVPELILDSFRIGEEDRQGIIFNAAQPSIVQSPRRRVTRTRPAVPASEPSSAWPLPCRIEGGPPEISTWTFEDEGATFRLPIALESDAPTAEPPAFFGVLIGPMPKDSGVLCWKFDRAGEIANGQGNRMRLGNEALADLRREAQWVDGSWLAALEDSQEGWHESTTPGSIATHPEVTAIRNEYRRLHAWLQQHETLPSLVEPWAEDYWTIVADLLKAVRVCITSNLPGSQSRLAWASMLGTVKTSAHVLKITSPLWPPALAAAEDLARKHREGSLSYPANMMRHLSATNAVPINLVSPGSPRMSLGRRRSIWTWTEWTPVDDARDTTHDRLGRVFRSTLERFSDNFRSLCGGDVPAPIRVRFIHVIPDETLVKAIEAYLKDGFARGDWYPERTLELEFLLDEPHRPTAIDARLDPGRGQTLDEVGFDPFRGCVRVAKLHTSALHTAPPGWDPYVHMTFIGSVTQYVPSTQPATEVEASSTDGGLVPSHAVDLHLGDSGIPIPFGAGIKGMTSLSPLQHFATAWNRSICVAAHQNPYSGQVPVPIVTPRELNARFPADIGKNSRWLVYLEPGVGLVPLSSPEFMGGSDHPILVHFSQTSARGVPGYSDVTLTEHVAVMEQSLETACRRYGARSAQELLPSLNSVNGTWLLKIVRAETNETDALDLLAEATAAHDLLPRLRQRHPDRIWVVAGWEDFHWVTGSTGNRQEDAVFVNPEGGSDDLLAVGLSRSEPLDVVAVVCEVKYGTSPVRIGLAQVNKTRDALIRQLTNPQHVGQLFRSQFGQYALRAAERMAAHGVMGAEDSMLLQSRQAPLRQGWFTVRTDHAESPGSVVHVDPGVEGQTQGVQDGITVMTIPFGEHRRNEPIPADAEGKAAPSAAPMATAPLVLSLKPTQDPSRPAEPVEAPAVTGAVRARQVAGPPPAPRASEPPAAVALVEPNTSWVSQMLLALAKPAPIAKRPVDKKIYRIDQFFREFKVEVEAPEDSDIVAGPQAVAVHLQPRAGVTIAKMRTALESLQVQLGSTQPLLLTTAEKAGYVTVFVPQHERVSVPFLSQVATMLEHPYAVPLPVGVTSTNEMVWLDLKDTVHLLMAGATGSGKTVYLKGVLLALIMRFSPKDLRIHLVDPKRLDFHGILDAPHLVSRGLTNAHEANALLESLMQEIASRQDLFQTRRASSLFEYNRKDPTSTLPIEVVVIDEFNQLRLGDRDEAAELERLVCQIAQLARAFGIYLIVSTQRPSVEVLSGDIKSNLPTRISFRLPTGTDSRVILDEEGAETLLPKGDGLFKDPGGRMIRFQALSVDDDTVDMVVAEAKRLHSQG